MTEEHLRISRMEIPPCPKCSQPDKQPIADLIGKDSAVCGLCGAEVVLSDKKEWLARLNEMAEGIRDQYNQR